MKKRMLLCILTVFILLIGLMPMVMAAERISVQETAVVVVGKTVTLTAENEENLTLTWSSADQSIATVDQNGTVTGVKAGEVEITVSAKSGLIKDTCTVTVVEIAPTDILITGVPEEAMNVGDSVRLGIDASPEGASTEVNWDSSDTNVLEVSETGKVTAVGVGAATITAVSKANAVVTDSVRITVTATGSCGENLTWVLSENGTLTIAGTGAMYDYRVYDSPWDYMCSSVKAVVVGDGVTTIGTWAFSDCTGLTSVTISDSVTSIGIRAFSACDSLTTVVIGSGVTAIGNLAFFDCSSLTEVHIKDLTAWCKIGFNDITANPLRYGADLYLNGELVEALDIPADVAEIGDYVFYNCESLTSVMMGDSVTAIGDSAFGSCSSLVSATIGDSVTAIGDSAFSSCSSLVSATIGDSVTTIGDHAFSGCTSLTEVHIKDLSAWCAIEFFNEKGGNTPLDGADLYLNGELVLVLHIPSDVTSISEYAFSGCASLTEVIIGDSVTTIGDDAFRYCVNLTEVTIGDSVTTIGNSAFYGCTSMTAVTIGDSVTTIGNSAFYGCTSLTAVTIGDSVTTIGNSAFYSCYNLTEVSLQGAVSVVGPAAFKDCEALSDITFLGDAPEIADDAFAGVTADCWYPADNATWTSDVMRHYGGRLNWKIIGSLCFGECGDRVRWILMQDGTLTVSGEGAMDDYAAPAAAPWDGQRFQIRAVVLDDGVTSVGENAFRGCSLVSVTLPDGVLSIGAGAFSNCYALTEITIPDSVRSVGDSAFYGCYKLSAAAIGENLSAIGADAFSGCYRLQELVFPDALESIGDHAFHGCSSLTEVVFPGQAPTIGSGAFTYVTAVCYYPAYDATWTTDTLQNYGGNLTWKAVELEIFSFAGTTMTLGNDLAINFMLDPADITGEGWYAEVVHGARCITIPQSLWGSTGRYLQIAYKGLTAKEMTDEVVITVYDANGFARAEKTDSARGYAMRMFGWSAEFDTVLADMLNYGAAAQLQFNYKTDDLANSLMTDAQKACATASVEMTDIRQMAGVYQGTTLELESNIVLNFFYAKEFVGKTATVTYVDHYGEAHRFDVIVEDYDSWGKVGVDKLVISDCSVPVTVTIDGVSVTDSVESYCARMQGYLELGEPLMKFASSARAYFGQ